MGEPESHLSQECCVRARSERSSTCRPEWQSCQLSRRWQQRDDQRPTYDTISVQPGAPRCRGSSETGRPLEEGWQPFDGSGTHVQGQRIGGSKGRGSHRDDQLRTLSLAVSALYNDMAYDDAMSERLARRSRVPRLAIPIWPHPFSASARIWRSMGRFIPVLDSGRLFFLSSRFDQAWLWRHILHEVV